MASEFRLPELGEDVLTGDVLRVLVAPGDRVTLDQPVLELETDKATIEVPVDVAGTVREVKVKVGDRVKVGQVILTLDGQAASSAPAPGATAVAVEPAPAAPSVESAPGSEVEPEPRLAAVEQSRRGEVVDIGRAPRAAAPESPPSPAADQAPAPAAPSVRRLARELGLDINLVQGGGPAGRIAEDDVKAFAKARVAGGLAAPSTPLPDFAKWGTIVRQPMRGVRRKTAEHLSHAWTTIPHVTQHDRADVTALEGLRHAKQAEKGGGALTVTAIALKVVASALKVFPQFNASIDMANDEIVVKQYIHVGVAVDTDRGLLVPVIRDVDRKTILELAREVGAAAEKARSRKLTLEEMEGGCFTITNLGGIGGTSFSPIVNWPEVAILGISRAGLRPVFIDGAFQPRLMLPLSLSYDHRAIDGADAVRFLRWVVEALEQPLLLSL